MKLHQSQSNPGTSAPLARYVSSFRVVHFDAGTVISIDGPANPFTLYSNAVFHARDAGVDFFDDVYLVSGNVVIEYSHERGAKLSPAPNEPHTSSSSTNDVDLVVNVNGATQLLAPNATRRRAIVQNLSTSVVYLSKTAAPPASANVGDKVLGVLAACGVAGDGSGGTLVLDEWGGAVYANAAAPALVGVGGY